jgi:hypothetical protein
MWAIEERGVRIKGKRILDPKSAWKRFYAKF